MGTKRSEKQVLRADFSEYKRVTLTALLVSLVFLLLTILMNLIPQEMLSKSLIESYKETPNLSSQTVSFSGNFVSTWNDCIAMHQGIARFGDKKDLLRNSVFDGDPCEANIKLSNNLNLANELRVYDFSRYWHGYSWLSKPLLAMSNWQTVRLTFFCLFLVVLALLSKILSTGNRTRRYFGYLAGFIILFTWKADQLIADVWVSFSLITSMLGAIVAVQTKKSRNRIYSFSLPALGGCIYAAGDVGLACGPVFICLLLLLHLVKFIEQERENMNVKEFLRSLSTLLACTFWSVFISMMIRFTVGGIVYSNETLLIRITRYFSDTTKYLSWRSIGNVEGKDIPFWSGITSNLKEFITTPINLSFFVALAVLLSVIKFARKTVFLNGVAGIFATAFFLQTVAMVTYYLLLNQQTTIHSNLTYRGVVPCLLTIYYALSLKPDQNSSNNLFSRS